MKLYIKTLNILLISAISMAHSHDETQQKNEITIVQASSNIDAVVAPQTHKCACGPMEHWLFKSCINKYIAQFPGCGLLENNDSEGLSENILQAMAMLVNDITFMDQHGMLIVPELNGKGKLSLSMSKNPDFKLYRDILSNVDQATMLSAEELYQQWTAALQVMKSAQ